MLARQAEENSMRRKGPRIFQSAIPDTDSVVHVVFICSTLSVVCSLCALNLYLKDFTDEDLIEILKNPSDHGPEVAVMACNLLGALAPLVLRNENGNQQETLVSDTKRTQIDQVTAGNPIKA